MSQTKFTESALFKQYMGITDTGNDEGSGSEENSSGEGSGVDTDKDDAAKAEQARLAEEQRLADEAASKENQPKGDEANTGSGEDEGTVKPTKVDIKGEYEKWLQEKESDLAEYFIQKSTDYSKMSPEKLLLKKLGEENPGLSADEVKELFKDDYGISDKIEIDEDLMDRSEVLAAKKHNSEIDKTLRKLNADAKKVAADFEKRKDTLAKPIFSVDVDSSSDEGKYTEEEFTSKYTEAQQAQHKANLDSWVSLVDEGVKPVDKFEYRNLSVELSEEDNKTIKAAALSYVAQEGDNEKFSDGKGGVDMAKFSAHVTKLVLLDKLIDAAGSTTKEGIAKKLSNYEDPNKNEASAISTSTEVNMWDIVKGRGIQR